jgi:hypothetical protein
MNLATNSLGADSCFLVWLFPRDLALLTVSNLLPNHDAILATIVKSYCASMVAPLVFAPSTPPQPS